MKHDIRESDGRFATAVDFNTIGLVCKLDELCRKAQQKFDDHGNNGMTATETAWLFAVARERPLWARGKLSEYGWGAA